MEIFTKPRKLLLAIESSCDETSAAVVEDETDVLSNVIATQIKSHKRFGGVVPEVASRHHVEQITVCIDEALKEAEVSPQDLSGVAVTYGPGLVGSLLIGITAAKSFAWANHLPLIPVNHMIGHLYAAKVLQPLRYPLLALLVSGGHTELVLMTGDTTFQMLGETRDDAAGEAYDKVGRVLGLSYPSGKPLDELAHQGKDTFHFPRAMIHEDNYDFSFSGLKSAFINTVHNAEQRGETLSKPDLAASFQAAVVEVLVEKTLRAAEAFHVKQVLIAGGVAANQGLRAQLTHAMKEKLPAVELIIPPLRLCGDNAAMIGAAGFALAKSGVLADGTLNADPSLEFPVMPQ